MVNLLRATRRLLRKCERWDKAFSIALRKKKEVVGDGSWYAPAAAYAVVKVQAKVASHVRGTCDTYVEKTLPRSIPASHTVQFDELVDFLNWYVHEFIDALDELVKQQKKNLWRKHKAAFLHLCEEEDALHKKALAAVHDFAERLAPSLFRKRLKQGLTLTAITGAVVLAIGLSQPSQVDPPARQRAPVAQAAASPLQHMQPPEQVATIQQTQTAPQPITRASLVPIEGSIYCKIPLQAFSDPALTQQATTLTQYHRYNVVAKHETSSLLCVSVGSQEFFVSYDVQTSHFHVGTIKESYVQNIIDASARLGAGNNAIRNVCIAKKETNINHFESDGSVDTFRCERVRYYAK